MLKKLLVVIPILVIFFVALAFGAQNAGQVQVNFLAFSAELSIAAVAGVFMGFGFLISLIFYFLSTLRWKLRYQRLLRKFNKLRQQNESEAKPDAEA